MNFQINVVILFRLFAIRQNEQDLSISAGPKEQRIGYLINSTVDVRIFT